MSASASCAKCGKPFLPGKPIAKALGKSFHKECLVCNKCGKSVLGSGGFVEVDGMPQCESCASAAQIEATPATKCKACKAAISGSFVKAFGFNFHAHCMVCAVCKKPLANDGFYDDVTDKILHLQCLTKL